ncbi:hypothetical protein OCU04_012458 [Sclerotinia nivalis]|uniref:Uncharacterized protein n=1 Tax=Sclerotinia nivalis TaxID=352851 RepID=A0A9X0DEW9_9HELO|nr:hypothetical protein OCU04_012458 [Sclerotinia nivalis]
MPNKKWKEQSPEQEDDLVDLTPSGFKYPFVAPSPETRRTMAGSRKSRKRELEEKEREKEKEKEREKEMEKEKEEREKEKSSQITKNQISFEQRKLKNWKDICSVTEQAVINTARKIISYALVAFLIAILWLFIISSLGLFGWLAMKKSIS